MLAGTTNYTLHGKNIVHMTQGSNELHFFYDASSKPAIVEFNGTKYAYVHNLQGDIVAILDSNGAVVVQYKYDAWGRPISKTGSMKDSLGKLNPFRYRGYVYDEETGLYYLRSRYYSSHLCRFHNTDTLINPDNSLLSGNAFAYCANQVVCNADAAGTYKTVVIFYWFPGSSAGFLEEVINSPYFDIDDHENVKLIHVTQKEHFIAAWNSAAMDGVENLYLYVHGGPGYISLYNDTTHSIEAGSADFRRLKSRQIDNVYLFSCDGAATPENGVSMASALTELTDPEKLFACDVGVSYRFDEDRFLHFLEGDNYYARAGGWSYYFGDHWYQYENSKAPVRLKKNKLK